FVLGGNPLLAAHDAGGEQAVDAWIAAQTQWSNEEIAQMLRELAIELVTRSELRPHDDDDEDADIVHIARDDDDDDDVVDSGDADRDRVRPAVAAPATDRRREVTAYAGELLAARARAGKLDPRVAATVRPLLDVAQKYEHRRISAVSILGALRDRDSLPAMIRILESTRIASALDAVGKEE